MIRRARIAVALASSVGVAGCSTDSVSPDSPDASPDVGCELALALSPSIAEIGGGAVTATAVFAQDPGGLRELEWSVTRGGSAVPFDISLADGTGIQFSADTAGVHTISVDGTVGTTACTGASVDFNVKAAGALPLTFRVRAHAPGTVAPFSQELFTTVWGGAEYSLGELALDAGVVASGTLMAGGVPQRAYVRATLRGSVGPLAIETFADARGAYALRVPSQGRWDLLIVPDSAALAPVVRANLPSSGLGGTVQLTAGMMVSGTVVSDGGAPVVGAKVSLQVGGVPSTLGVTGAAGSFAVRAQPGAPAAVSIVPPEGSGLPRLDGTVTSLVAGASIAVVYAPIAIRTHSFELDDHDGGPAVAGRATFLARPIPAAASVSVDGNPANPMLGSARITAVANASGQIGGLSLPDAIYDVVVQSADPAALPLLAVADLRGGQVGTLQLPEAGVIQGSAVDAAGNPVAGATIAAAGSGPLANMAAASATVQTAADGSFALPLVPGGAYTLTISPPPSAAISALAFPVSAPAAGVSQPIAPAALPRAIAVNGTIAVPGQAGEGAGVHLLLTCATCADSEPTLAQSTADIAGRFSLRVPDPGTAP